MMCNQSHAAIMLDARNGIPTSFKFCTTSRYLGGYVSHYTYSTVCCYCCERYDLFFSPDKLYIHYTTTTTTAPYYSFKSGKLDIVGVSMERACLRDYITYVLEKAANAAQQQQQQCVQASRPPIYTHTVWFSAHKADPSKKWEVCRAPPPVHLFVG